MQRATAISFTALRARPVRWSGLLALTALLAACGGGGGGSSDAKTETSPMAQMAATLVSPTTQLDAVRLANQASFGPSEALVAEIRNKGRKSWVVEQLGLSESAYVLGGNGAIHQNTSTSEFCDLPAQAAVKANGTCWRDWYTERPLAWDFYRNAIGKKDQLRQRVALALSQIAVVSANTVTATYGLRNYQNKLLELSFSNYRDVLRAVALSPVMGDYLNGVNNDKAAPNENFARELLQLFSLGPCLLNADGELANNRCDPVYDNTQVRNYAYAMTGWTFPAGGATHWGCPTGWNCRYYGGDMVSRSAFHDTAQRTLLAGVTVPAGSSAESALDKVLDSLMAHQNIAPFISKQLIQHLVTSNPSAAYVNRVADAFRNGRFQVSGSATVGTGRKGDLSATVAAILLDAEAQRTTALAGDGRLREPAMLIPAVFRALNGVSDGQEIWWWGVMLQQPVFNAPSVFNFFPPDYPVPGTSVVGPAFGVFSANTGLTRLNFLTSVLWWSHTPDTTTPALPDGTNGQRINLTPFESDATQPDVLVDRLSAFLIGRQLPAAARAKVIEAVAAYNTSERTLRVKQAAYLVLASPQFQVLR